MKVFVAILAFINGGFMLLDGIYVLVKGKYIGPEKPGPWSVLFSRSGIDVFKLGPLFIIFGIAWLIFLLGLWRGQSWAYGAGLVVSLLTLWYLPVGTVIAVAVGFILLFAKKKLGI